MDEQVLLAELPLPKYTLNEEQEKKKSCGNTVHC